MQHDAENFDEQAHHADRSEVDDESEGPRLLRLIAAVRELSAEALALERTHAQKLERVHPEHALGARNLLHYLAVRQRDLRPLQADLAALGLSSLGRMERCVVETLARVEHALHCLRGEPPERPFFEGPLRSDAGERLLAKHTDALLGPAPKGRRTRIMVTLAPDDDGERIEALLDNGMNVARINCAKGQPKAWQLLVDRVRQARERTEIPCSVLFDLAGPNPRTLRFDTTKKSPALAVGDRFVLATERSDVERARSTYGELGIIGCTMPEIMAHVKPGERVLYDDGRLEGTILANERGLVLIDVVRTLKAEIKLRDERSLTFPDSQLPLPSLTEKDLEDLDFIVEHADLVGLSFVRGPSDVEVVRGELAKRGGSELGLILKIETTSGFTELGPLLLMAMQHERVGVMVARGDMAVELGYVRLAEAQEEVLWLGEAALVPVIWATQVLEKLTKKGVPSRAEVTDAAMSGRAECVMLNRGDYINEAVVFLDEVLTRMQAHQNKKRSLLRRLSISDLSA
ncbi:MAG TPA: pyruvate kinase [Polyangiaceae bacterium]|nr:pyruvate kinase [Polyangiaceae bacterium]